MQSYLDKNKSVIEELLPILEKGQAILLAGSGCFVDQGYPDWSTLIIEMHSKLAPSLSFENGIDVKIAAEMIKNYSFNLHQRLEPYERFIREKFQPKPNCFDGYHCNLVHLGFGGITTTNYDVGLENAISASFISQHSGCQTINLCVQNEKYLLLEFLRNLGQHAPPRHVLHLHGCYSRPENIVLTQRDYEFYYNGIDYEIAPDERRKIETRDTLHRKTIWTILATKSVVFIGFSFNDSFFIDVIDVWKQDFDVIEEKPHFAFIGIQSEEQIIKIEKDLGFKGIKPIFYEIPSSDSKNHNNLKSLIAEIAERRGVRMTESTVNEISRRNLGLL